MVDSIEKPRNTKTQRRVRDNPEVSTKAILLKNPETKPYDTPDRTENPEKG